MSTSGIHEECETCGKPRWAHRQERMCTEIVQTNDALAKPVDGMSDSNYETGQTLWREWFESGGRKPPEIPTDTSLMLTWIVAKFRATLRAEVEWLTRQLEIEKFNAGPAGAMAQALDRTEHELQAAREQLIMAHDEISDQLANAERLKGERDAVRKEVIKWADVCTPILDALERGKPLGSMGITPEPFVVRIKELRAAQAALSQAQQALRELCDAVNYEVDLNLSAKIKKAMKRVRAALPSDAPEAAK